MIGVILNCFWFSYILVITILSGILVLFIYIARVASNEKFYLSIKLILTSLVFITIILLFNCEPIESIIQLNNKYIVLSLNKLFNQKTLIITVIIVIYLLFSIIVVSKIVNVNEGPLRIKK